MKKYIYLFLAFVAFGMTSCNDWLDVHLETEQKEDEQFSTYDGFCDALTGCYMTLASQDIYGERLSITYIESLANLWYMEDDSETGRKADYDLKNHNYTTTTAESAIQTMYAGLFNVIAQANSIIKNVDEKGESVILDPKERAVIQGEAYAIRALCQLDVLRLFGQVPGGSKNVELPYSETTSIYEVPPYYDFDSYVAKLTADLQKAEELLLNNDPVFQYTFKELNSGSSTNIDQFMLYRQSRMNYWAVKALEARMYLYTGQKSKAYETAMEIINAKLNGNSVITMSGIDDFTAGYKLCPSECLFYLSKYNIMEYTQSYLIGGSTTTQYQPTTHLVITTDMLSELYNGEHINSHNRYLNIWNRNVRDGYGQYKVTTTKYYWDEDNVENAMFYYQIIPMLRMSEIYLIAIECATNLSEANQLYQTYMFAHAVSDMPDFTSSDEINNFILNEYRREFFVEGQMFYTYKRKNAASMLWCDHTINEDTYILPLPSTEYNPNNY